MFTETAMLYGLPLNRKVLKMISKDTENKILKHLPFSKPFLFVDHILDVNENGITGTHKFLKSEAFYKGHFTDNPITPGVLLLETMGQIGLVCFGIYLLRIHETNQPFLPYLSHLESDFLAPVYPDETVTVHASKEYFRNNILKCTIEMRDAAQKVVLTNTTICTFKLIVA